MSTKRGFTLIELLVSIAIMTILGLMAIPGTVNALARGAVNNNADELLQVIHQAQLMARRAVPNGPPELQPHYGVALLPGPGGVVRATVLYGDTEADEWLVDGVPGFSRRISSTFLVSVGFAEGTPAPLAAPLAWFFQFGTAQPIANTADQTPVGVGTHSVPPQSPDRVFSGGDRYYSQDIPAIPASPICSDLNIRRANGGRYVVSIAIYDIGLAHRSSQ